MNRMLAVSTLTGAMIFSLPASGSDAGSGVLNFSGSIVNAPCNLSMEEANQTVNLGQHKNEQVNAFFSIAFTDCTATPAKISFTGPYADDAYELLTSTAGLALTLMILSKTENTLVQMDGAMNPLPDFVDGDNTIRFKAYTTSGDWSAVVPGPYTASANFTMHYE